MTPEQISYFQHWNLILNIFITILSIIVFIYLVFVLRKYKMNKDLKRLIVCSILFLLLLTYLIPRYYLENKISNTVIENIKKNTNISNTK
jgi:heme A synthase